LTEFGTPFQTKQRGKFFNFWSEFTVQLVATNTRQVVTTILEECRFKISTRRLGGWWFAWASTLINFNQCFFARWGDGTLFLPLSLKETEVGNETIDKSWCVFFVVAERTQNGEDAEATFASHTCAASDIFARLLLNIEFEPLTAIRVNRAFYQLVLRQVAQAITLTRFEDDARRTNQL